MKTNTLTIRLDEELDKLLTKAAKQSGKNRSEIAREALRRQLRVSQFEALRRKIMPFAEARGYLTDEDVFSGSFMRVLLDTNVIVSAVTTRGLCADVFRAVLAAHELVTCAQVLQEVRRILSMKFLVPEQLIAEYLELIGQDAIWPSLETCRTSPSRTRMTRKSSRRPSAPGRRSWLPAITSCKASRTSGR